MALLRSDSLDDRRRRMLTEEVKTSMATASTDETPRGEPRSKRDPAPLEPFPRLTDLVPRRWLAYAIAFFASIMVVAMLEAAHYYMPSLELIARDGRIAAFDLNGPSSLATWVSSTTLSAAAMVSLLVYAIRRRRVDDYRGHYRVWLWAAATWLLMSLDECGGLHDGFRDLMIGLTGHQVMGDGSIWWVGAYGFLGTVIGARLIIEMRGCWSSTTAFLLAIAAFGVAVTAHLKFVLAEAGVLSVMIEEGCELVGNFLLLLAMTLHARYVILEAEGGLPAKAKKEPRAKRAKSEEKSTPVKRSDLTSPAKAAPLDEDDEDEDDDDDGRKLRLDEGNESNRRLSKSERKLMRRQQRG